MCNVGLIGGMRRSAFRRTGDFGGELFGDGRAIGFWRLGRGI